MLTLVNVSLNDTKAHVAAVHAHGTQNFVSVLQLFRMRKQTTSIHMCVAIVCADVSCGILCVKHCLLTAV